MAMMRENMLLTFATFCVLGLFGCCGFIYFTRIVSAEETVQQEEVAMEEKKDIQTNTTDISDKDDDDAKEEVTQEEESTSVKTKDVLEEVEEDIPVVKEDVNVFKSCGYYKENRLDRYRAYHELYPDYNVCSVIANVNANIDYDFYTNDIPTDMTKGTLVLVNKYNYLSSYYEPDDLVPLTGIYNQSNKNNYLRKVAYDAFISMSDAARQAGLSIYNMSAYRSYYTQDWLYEYYAQVDGYDEADTYSARPGYSEHQTGLALDVNDVSDYFVYTDEYAWLKDNSYKYGFILRYPYGKDYITGYKFEPWHYRYVGVDVATYIYEHNITFDEYYGYFLSN